MQNDEILSNAGYARNHERDIWFSRSQRKSFSHHVLRDRDSKWLALKLDERVPEGEFRFYRNTSNIEVCMEILFELELPHLIPVESLN